MSYTRSNSEDSGEPEKRDGSGSSPLLSGSRFLPVAGGVLNVRTGQFVSAGEARRRSEREGKLVRLAVVLDAEVRLIERATKTYSADGLDEMYCLAAKGTVTFTGGQFVIVDPDPSGRSTVP